MIKNRSIFIATIVLILCFFSGCSSPSINDSEVKSEPKEIITETDLNSKIHSMSNLATLEVKYHNVAEKTLPAGTGFQALGEKERKFWVEYESSVTIGVNTSKINASIKNDTITIEIPDAEILKGNDWDSKNAQIFYSPDSINSNEFSPTQKDDTVNAGQQNMRETISKNDTLMVRAKDNTKSIIQSFVGRMSEINGIDYKIVWKDKK